LWLWQMLPGLFYVLLMPLSFFVNPMFNRFLPEPLDRFSNETGVAIAFMALAFISMLMTMLLAVAAQTATTYGAVKVDKGAEKLAFMELFHESRPYYWRVLGVYAIFGGAWLLLMIAFMAVSTAGSMITMGLASFCFIPFFLLLFPIAFVGYSVLELAQAAIITNNLGTLNSISHGWKVFRANWLSVILLMVILCFALYILSSIVLLPIMVPMMWSMISMEENGSFVSTSIFIVLPFIFLIGMMVQEILMTFFQVAWAVAYIRLNRNSDTPIVLEEKSQEARL
jgi:hypothetical protein